MPFSMMLGKLFLYEKEEVIGKNINSLMPDYFARMHDTYLNNYLTTGVKKIIGIGIPLIIVSIR